MLKQLNYQVMQAEVTGENIGGNYAGSFGVNISGKIHGHEY